MSTKKWFVLLFVSSHHLNPFQDDQSLLEYASEGNLVELAEFLLGREEVDLSTGVRYFNVL
jgi:hypothetical protein